MKKTILLLLFSLLFTGCTQKQEEKDFKEYFYYEFSYIADNNMNVVIQNNTDQKKTIDIRYYYREDDQYYLVLELDDIEINSKQIITQKFLKTYKEFDESFDYYLDVKEGRLDGHKLIIIDDTGNVYIDDVDYDEVVKWRD